MASTTPVSALTLAALAQRQPHFVDWGIRLDRAPACLWLGLQAAALAPTGIWMARALHGGWDEPLGLLALAAIAFFVWRARRELRASPRLGWLALGTLSSLSATLLHTGVADRSALPLWVAGLLAVAALVCSLRAFLPQRMALAPLAGLAMLTLPLLSALKVWVEPSMSVVLGDTLHRLSLPAFHVAGEGSALWMGGVQLVWLGCFTACSIALWTRLSAGTFLARLPWVGLILLIGSLAGDAAWTALAASAIGPQPWMRQALGAVVPALACGGIAALMAPARRPFVPSFKGETHAARTV
ncbi:MAG: exosortase Q [Pseudomonadota bacterium]